ncbi:MAG: response regulator transcription factor [Acidimicrobiia bacterium]|nr:response regulator transcription factor [Acidimicrobiia bacterium]
MSGTVLRVIIADDERPARKFLAGLLKECDGVELVGEAAAGVEAVSLIESQRPHLALLDLQMPELGGLDVARRVPKSALPLIAFVTAFDDHAIEAFELNAIDYLLKPVQQTRLQATLDRARDRMRAAEPAESRAAALASAAASYERAARRPFTDRLPVRCRDEVVLVSVRQIASIASEGELLHITTLANERYTITHRLHLLEARLDPRRFIRLGRGTLANVDAITRVSPMPGGTYLATLSNGQQLQVSRIQSRLLRDTLLKL